MQGTSRPRRETRRTSDPQCGHCSPENRKSSSAIPSAESAGTPTTATPTRRGTTSCTGHRRNTGPRSGGPGRSPLLRSAKLAGATRSGHRRQTGAPPRGGNGTPGFGPPRLPKGALRASLRRVQRGARPRQQHMRESWRVPSIDGFVPSISTSDNMEDGTSICTDQAKSHQGLPYAATWSTTGSVSTWPLTGRRRTVSSPSGAS